MVTLKNIDGRKVELDITQDIAAAIAPAIGKGWAIGYETMRPTFVPIGVPERDASPTPRPRVPIPDADLEAVLRVLMPGEQSSMEALAHAAGTGDRTSRILQVLKGKGQAAVSGRGKGARWRAVAKAASATP